MTDLQVRRHYDGIIFCQVSPNDSNHHSLGHINNERIRNTAVGHSTMTDDGNDMPLSAVERITRYYCSDEIPSKLDQRQHTIKQPTEERTNRRRKERRYTDRNMFTEHDNVGNRQHHEHYPSNPASVSVRSPSVLTELTSSITSRRNETDTANSTQFSEPFLKGRKPDFGELSVVNNTTSPTRISRDVLTDLVFDEHKEREHHLRQLEMYDQMLAPTLAEAECQKISLTSGLSNSQSQLTPAPGAFDSNRFHVHNGESKAFCNEFDINNNLWQTASRRGSMEGNFRGNDNDLRFRNKESIGTDFYLNDNNRHATCRNHYDDGSYQLISRKISEQELSTNDRCWYSSKQNGINGNDTYLREDKWQMSAGRRESRNGHSKTHSIQNPTRARSIVGNKRIESGGSIESLHRSSPANSGTSNIRRQHQNISQGLEYKNPYVDEDGRLGDHARLYAEDEKYHSFDRYPENDDRYDRFSQYDDDDRRYSIPHNVVNNSLWKQIESRSSKLNSTIVSKESKEEAIAAVFNFFNMNEVDLEKMVAPSGGHTVDRSCVRPPKRIQTTNEHDDSVSGVTTPTQLGIPTSVLPRKKSNNKKKKQIKEARSNRPYGTPFATENSHGASPSTSPERKLRRSILERDEMTSISSIATSVDYYISGGYSNTGRPRRHEFHDSRESMIVEEDEAYLEEQFDKFNIDNRPHDTIFELPSWVDHESHDINLENSFRTLDTQLEAKENDTAMYHQSVRSREVEADDSLFLSKEVEKSLLRQLQMKKSKGNMVSKGIGHKKGKTSKEQRPQTTHTTVSSTASPKSLQQRLDKHFVERKNMATKNKCKQKLDLTKQNGQFSLDFGDLDRKSSNSTNNDGADTEQFLICCDSVSGLDPRFAMVPLMNLIAMIVNLARQNTMSLIHIVRLK
jgi:hypothetical protein